MSFDDFLEIPCFVKEKQSNVCNVCHENFVVIDDFLAVDNSFYVKLFCNNCFALEEKLVSEEFFSSLKRSVFCDGLVLQALSMLKE